MKTFHRPKIVVSQCLEFDECRYNGQVIPSGFVKKLVQHVDFVPVCPEVEIGLGIPRDPIRLIEKKGNLKLMQPSTGRDVTAAMRTFSKAYLKSLKNVDGFILKYGSPSCGPSNVKVYPSGDNPVAVRKGPGMFADAVLENYAYLAVEDEGRLTNFRIREHFLTKVFLSASFRKIKETNSHAALVKFHADNKLLMMAYSQKYLKILGRIAANPDKRKFSELIEEYESNFYEAFKRNAKFTSHINVFMHALGYFKKELNQKEKAYFLTALNRYKNEVIPLSAVTSIIQSWIVKYENEYLDSQTYFMPYPEELITITDSGKGRDGK